MVFLVAPSATTAALPSLAPASRSFFCLGLVSNPVRVRVRPHRLGFPMEQNGLSGREGSGNYGTAATDSAGIAYDSHLYGETPAAHYVTEIEVETPLADGGGGGVASAGGSSRGAGVERSAAGRTEDASQIAERERMLLAQHGDRGGGFPGGGGEGEKSIAAREDFYRRQRFQRALSPERVDPFSDGFSAGSGSSSKGADSSTGARTYADVMLEQQLDREKQAAVRQIRKMQEEAELQRQLQKQQEELQAAAAAGAGEKKRRRWDWGGGSATPGAAGGVWTEQDGVTEAERQLLMRNKKDKDDGGSASAAAAALVSRWDTPLQGGGQTPGAWGGETPLLAGGGGESAVARAAVSTAPKKKSRWDATPTVPGGTGQVSAEGPVGCEGAAGVFQHRGGVGASFVGSSMRACVGLPGLQRHSLRAQTDLKDCGTLPVLRWWSAGGLSASCTRASNWPFVGSCSGCCLLTRS